MNAEQYLKRIAELISKIENKQQKADDRMGDAYPGAIRYDQERVQSSGAKDNMANAVIDSVDIQQEIQGYKRELQEIESKLDKLSAVDPDAYHVLYQLYFLHKSYRQIAFAKNKSISWVKQKRRTGLNEFNEILRRYDEEGIQD